MLIAAILLGAFLLFFILYWRGFRRERNRQTMLTQAQRDLMVYERWVPKRAEGRIRSRFEPDQQTGRIEEEILLVTRRRGIVIAMKASLVALAGLVATYLSVRLVMKPIGLSYGNAEALSAKLPWWIPVLVTLAWLIGIFVMWVDWSSYFLVFTTTFVQVRREYPPILFWLPPRAPTIPWERVDIVDPDPSIIGRLLNYGTLRMNTASTGDDAFHDIKEVPYVFEVQSMALDAKAHLMRRHS